MIGIGVIGCGGMGSWHAGNAARQPGCSVVAVADVFVAAAESVAERTGARVVDPMQLIAAPDVDAVIIASSDESHAEFANAAIAAGKPCLIEKPLGATLAQARSILDAELAAGHKLVRVGFMRELDPAHRQVAASVAELGQITKIRCVHRNVDAAPRPVELLFAQSLIHDIHSIRWLAGDEIVAVRVHVVERSDGFRDVLMICNLAGGGLGVIEFEDQGFAYEVQVEVSALGGMAATLPHPRSVERRAGAESLPVGMDWFARFEDAYRLEIEDWVASIRDDLFRGPTVWDGYAAQVVADAAQRSIERNAEVAVELPEAPELYR
ncbi:MAG: Gfo/Idh/MocA family oxidoreductase [Acidimicrobiales bacterium]